ncbi:MAG: hypothetical protein MT490_08455 [Sphingomonas sp.]|uniref:hypothetical protein n=1 Tax=Sphingomonas sp. TaxID=28214 RepID=UPI0022733748|nr:hypothetical protein [Sphingomonas sp.]MCX8475813.1 hypothetical protein [Sphingomonas sp.]
MKLTSVAALGAAAALVCAVAPVRAQEATADAGSAPAAVSATTYLADSASPFGVPDAIDPASIKMPELQFKPDPSDAGDYDKYYYFHRLDTDFATAYADVRECDGYARGLVSGIGYTQVPYPYAGTLAGAIGGALGDMLAQAIWGSGEKRRVRRVNMRTCMHFKGYDRYGLPKKLWTEFNFEEGLSGVSEKDRTRYLQQQALVASSAKPEEKALGL